VRAPRHEADAVVIGSGVSGVLVARELMRRGRHVTMVERGRHVPWEEQLEHVDDVSYPIVEGAAERFEGNGAGARHNDENASDGVDWLWQYVYAVGGTCNHWVGVAPRFLPEDFEMRSRYGVFVDWPLSYEELEPYYEEAERTLGVTGGTNELQPGAKAPVPAHPLSPQDRALAPHLAPFVPLWQARPSRQVGERPPCCGSSRCELCPVDSRFSVLNGLPDVLEDPELELLTETVAARFVTDGGRRRIAALECFDPQGERMELRARDYVLAANAIESPGLLLRSGLKTPDTGRYFASRESLSATVTTRTDLKLGYGATKSTGASYAYYSGAFRSERSAALLVTENPGRPEVMFEAVARKLAAGGSASDLRAEAVRRWSGTATFSIVLEDEPLPQNRVTLSATKDDFGLPLNRVRYNAGPYETGTVEHLLEDLPKRLRPLGATDMRLWKEPQGAHLLGTLRMGEGDRGVVDRDLCHHGLDNLYVAGGAVLPTFSATHPTLTIAALAIRLGRSIEG
jgi:choline dehydrogenase-like flavoprotein